MIKHSEVASKVREFIERSYKKLYNPTVCYDSWTCDSSGPYSTDTTNNSVVDRITKHVDNALSGLELLKSITKDDKNLNGLYITEKDLQEAHDQGFLNGRIEAFNTIKTLLSIGESKHDITTNA